MKKTVLIAITIFLILQVVAIVGQISASYVAHDSAITEVKQRVSLDIYSLDLGTENAASVANEDNVIRYIVGINSYLSEHNYPVRLLSIDNISESNSIAGFSNTHTELLVTNNENIQLTIALPATVQHLSVSYIGIILALLYVVISRGSKVQETNDASASNVGDAEPAAKLVIDLRQKALYLESSDLPVTLSNKPFCFYVALLRFCQSEDTAELIHHKEIPKTLLIFANETFSRLMKLGHTKRRQPDFSTNLDKTLSEIRAALEEVYQQHPLEKTPFYPPKAQGEGSRTKRHSYALENLDAEKYTIIFD